MRDLELQVDTLMRLCTAETLTEQAYILPLFEEPVVYGVQPYIQGFQPEAIGRPSFYGAWIDSEFKEGQQ